MTAQSHMDQAFAALLGLGPLKTWSVIVTILGDLAAQPEARISGPVLTALTDTLGVRPEALRVAVHRLRRDGWITSERVGRTSLYSLTPHGLELTRSVSDRVYGQSHPKSELWHIVVAQNSDGLEALDLSDAVILNSRAALVPGLKEPIGLLPSSVLSWEAKPGQVPEWVGRSILPDHVESEFKHLSSALATVQVSIEFEGKIRDIDPVRTAALRFLALHNWRRLVLRLGQGGETLLAADWIGARCRQQMRTVLERLPRPDPNFLVKNRANNG